MRYFFTLRKNNKILNVKQYSKLICIGGKMFLDGIEYLINDISIDLLNNKTHIYVTIV